LLDVQALHATQHIHRFLNPIATPRALFIFASAILMTSDFLFSPPIYAGQNFTNSLLDSQHGWVTDLCASNGQTRMSNSRRCANAAAAPQRHVNISAEIVARIAWRCVTLVSLVSHTCVVAELREIYSTSTDMI
jgi:hypothetical protein